MSRIPPRTPEQIERDKQLSALIRESIDVFSALPQKQKAEIRRAQRRSWVIGELMLVNPEMSRERAERLVDEAESNK